MAAQDEDAAEELHYGLNRRHGGREGQVQVSPGTDVAAPHDDTG